MHSHLGGGTMPDAAGNVFHASEIDAQSGGGVSGAPHGTPVAESAISWRRMGGSRGDIVGVADPRDRNGHANAVEVPRQRRSGSATVVGMRDLPAEQQAGSSTHVSVASLDQMDRMSATRLNANVSSPTEPGLYQLHEGAVMVILPDGRRGILSAQEWAAQGNEYLRFFAQLRAAQQQQQVAQARPEAPQQPQGLLARVLNATLR